jgi:hypothetical protein
METVWIRDPEGKNSDPGYGIKIPDPQHWNFLPCHKNICVLDPGVRKAPDPRYVSATLFNKGIKY